MATCRATPSRAMMQCISDSTCCQAYSSLRSPTLGFSLHFGLLPCASVILTTCSRLTGADLLLWCSDLLHCLKLFCLFLTLLIISIESVHLCETVTFHLLPQRCCIAAAYAPLYFIHVRIIIIFPDNCVYAKFTTSLLLIFWFDIFEPVVFNLYSIVPVFCTVSWVFAEWLSV